MTSESKEHQAQPAAGVVHAPLWTWHEAERYLAKIPQHAASRFCASNKFVCPKCLLEYTMDLLVRDNSMSAGYICIPCHGAQHFGDLSQQAESKGDTKRQSQSQSAMSTSRLFARRTLTDADKTWQDARWLHDGAPIVPIRTLDALLGRIWINVVGAEASGKKTAARYLERIHRTGVSLVVHKANEVPLERTHNHGLLIMARPSIDMMDRLWKLVEKEHNWGFAPGRMAEFQKLLQKDIPKYSALLLWEELPQWMILEIPDDAGDKSVVPAIEPVRDGAVPDWTQEPWLGVFAHFSECSTHEALEWAKQHRPTKGPAVAASAAPAAGATAGAGAGSS